MGFIFLKIYLSERNAVCENPCRKSIIVQLLEEKDVRLFNKNYLS
jgi:hypothetical protein